MTAVDGVAAVLVLAGTIYPCPGLADCGGGFVDLVAGGRERGRRPRALIDSALTPIWEANHVWLVFLLVTCWTGFGVAFGAIMTTLFVPLALAALGIVLRGANFALRKDATHAGVRHLSGWLFGIGSVITPFFLGAALGGVLSARVPQDGAASNELTSWWNATSITVGLLAVAMGAFLSAVYLVVEANRRGLPKLRDYFRVRAAGAGVVGLLLGAAALAALGADEQRMFDRVTGRGWPLIVAGALALGTTFLFAVRGVRRGVRVAAAVGVAALVWTWGVAQYPYLLPFELTIAEGAGAAVTQRWLLAWFVVALLVLAPGLALLYVLDQRGELSDHER
ncbi:cytochrome d ubiquinol oxidase subunit II [Micromonospora sp. CPCC 205371]|nr:cytochrome d ubiquinol oxidase subunit II [Micromonospora sp. CPCC 205371]